jgi:2-polyprenyl-6-methoxyphenol hydroxylase-like FAD-dependent oxidoreductase
VFVAWPREALPAVRADIEGEVMRVLDGIPELSGRVRQGRREEPFRGATELPNFLRKPFGAGWALVGDAGCHKDPYLALGVCDAFRDAELLANALDDSWSGRRPLDAAMNGFEQQRNDATLRDYQQNVQFARLQPPPAEVLGLRAALKDDQQEINRFYLANEGMIPPGDFFNPGNMGRVMARSGAPAATVKT